jgi:hypothetical protein
MQEEQNHCEVEGSIRVRRRWRVKQRVLCQCSRDLWKKKEVRRRKEGEGKGRKHTGSDRRSDAGPVTRDRSRLASSGRSRAGRETSLPRLTSVGGKETSAQCNKLKRRASPRRPTLIRRLHPSPLHRLREETKTHLSHSTQTPSAPSF